MVLIGVQPVELEDYGGSLRPAVRDQLDPAIGRALAVLRSWGVAARDADDVVEPGVEALGLDRYESERPSADAACRYGDERVLMRRDGRVA
jgi:hydrogenase maturation protease